LQAPEPTEPAEDKEPVASLMAARGKLVDQRRALARRAALQPPHGVEQEAGAIVRVQAAVDAIDRAIADEFALAADEARDAPPQGALEHIPVHAYHLLRRLAADTLSLTRLGGVEEAGAVQFLLSRGLAEQLDGSIKATAAGRAIGEVSDER